MFIPPHLVGQPSVNQNRRPAYSTQAPNDSAKNAHSSYSLSSTFVISDAVAATTDAYAFDEVLSTSDIVVGAILAFALAFGWSFLNGQSTSSNFISWRSQLHGSRDNAEASTSGIVDTSSDITKRSGREERNECDTDDDSTESDISAPKVFNADNWKEMSREENYVLYNTRVRAVRDSGRERKADRIAVTTKGDTEGDIEKASGVRSEKKWVLVALLVLFVPIFSVEFFFALSRQFMCGGDPLNQSEWAQILCSPYRGP